MRRCARPEQSIAWMERGLAVRGACEEANGLANWRGGEGLGPFPVAPIDPTPAIAAAAPIVVMAPVRVATALLLDLAALLAALLAHASINASAAIGIAATVGGIRAFAGGLCHAKNLGRLSPDGEGRHCTIPNRLFCAVILRKYRSRCSMTGGRCRAPTIQPMRMRL